MHQNLFTGCFEQCVGLRGACPENFIVTYCSSSDPQFLSVHSFTQLRIMVPLYLLLKKNHVCQALQFQTYVFYRLSVYVYTHIHTHIYQ